MILLWKLSETLLQLNLPEARYLSNIGEKHAEWNEHAAHMQQRLMQLRTERVLAAHPDCDDDLADMLRGYGDESPIVRAVARLALFEHETQMQPDPDAGTAIFEVSLPEHAVGLVYAEASDDATVSDEQLALSDMEEVAAATRDDLQRRRELARGVRDILHPLIQQDFA